MTTTNAAATQPLAPATTTIHAPSSCGGGAPPAPIQQDPAKGGGAAIAPPATTDVAGSGSGPTGQAKDGAKVVQAGGGLPGGDMLAITQALTSLIEVLKSLIDVLSKGNVAGASGGGPGKDPGRDPMQVPPIKGGGDPKQHGDDCMADCDMPMPPPPPTEVAGEDGPAQVDETPEPPKLATGCPEPTQVDGDTGGPIQKAPTQVDGENGGPAQKAPEQKAPTQVDGENGGPAQEAPKATAPVQQAPPAEVGGENGGPAQKAPEQRAPTQVDGEAGGPAPKAPEQKAPVQQAPPAEVGGENGGPVQQTPTTPVQKGPVAGDVVLSDKDQRSSATLTSKSGNSVEIWGDPHVIVKFGGTEQKFDIGYGPGSITLADGTKVSWDTYADGHAREHRLSEFSIDSAGAEFDREVTSDDGVDASGLTTTLTDAQLQEFAAELKMYEGNWQEPLTRKDAKQAA